MLKSFSVQKLASPVFWTILRAPLTFDLARLILYEQSTSFILGAIVFHRVVDLLMKSSVEQEGTISVISFLCDLV